MANREELIVKARELIKAQPKAGRREIAKDLRREYGSALRDAVILSLQREIYPKPQALIYRRKASLERGGFTPKEAKAFSTLTFKNVSWFEKVRRDRAKELRSLVKQGLTKRQVKREIKNLVTDKYAVEGWELADGKIDPWQMFRDMRAEAIKQGEWKKTPRKRGSHRRKEKRDDSGLVRIDKGKVEVSGYIIPC